VCSGGRYDNLAGLYSQEKLSGVGSSIGLDRLIAAKQELLLQAQGAEQKKQAARTYADVAVVCTNESDAGLYQNIAEKLRERGIAVEVFAEEKKQGAQFELAEKKGLRWALAASVTRDGLYTLRNIEKRISTDGLSIDDVASLVKARETKKN
jgi:histidyl-tRNA synthetase